MMGKLSVTSIQLDMTVQYLIPDLLVTWPWKRLMNPMLAEINDEANAWVKSLDLLEPSREHKFYSSRVNRLAALFGPLLESKDHLRIICDFLNFLFILDEYIDIADKTEAGKIANDIMDNFRHREPGVQLSSHGKIIGGVQECFQRIASTFGQDFSGIERLISDLDASMKSAIVEAEERSTGHLRTVNDYILLRRDTSAAKPTFSCLGLGLNIPNVVFDNPLMVSLLEDAADLIGLVNDMHSYRIERSRGLEVHNILTVIMEEHHLDLQQALYWLSGYASRLISNFLANRRALPSWGEKIDEAIAVYIERVARCVRGNDAWHYETNRYYGDDGLKVQECRKMTLLPPGDYGYITRDQLENLL